MILELLVQTQALNQLAVDSCTTEECCQKLDVRYHYILSQCLICEEFFGHGSYYHISNCLCADGTAGLNSVCDDCWSKALIVFDHACLNCSKYDKYAVYDYENQCKCLDGMLFINNKCFSPSQRTTQIIISSVISVTILILILVLILVVLRRRKQNQIEFKTKTSKYKLKTEHEQNLVVELGTTQLDKMINEELNKAAIQNQVVIVDDIEKMQQIIQEIEVRRVDEIKEGEVRMYQQ
ncbi:Growth_factor receptor cysteine-rich domain superfamily [Hexamita inflata]|uniref:Growth factor receptor cysteine-rich domain superfamily n=1 Tax=Hexamita inflata TaxID=28002 RepID=A0AA86PQX1_9EUKA|nr:Growth factor receptor cysteine-rich domain superfamily [Hexamita inflata]